MNDLPSRPRQGAAHVPRVIVLHYSAGYNTAQCIEVLRGRGISVHSCIDRDGFITQLLTDDRVGYHVLGGRRWGVVPDVNVQSFGAEIINIGYLDGRHGGPIGTRGADQYDPADDSDGGALPELLPDPTGVWYRMEKGYAYEGHKVRVLTRQTAKTAAFVGGSEGLWAEYPSAQMQGVIVWVHTLMRKYQILPEYVVGHEHVQDNKSDPGPAFPWGKGFWGSIKTNPPYPECFDPGYRTSERIAALQSHLARIGAGPGAIDGDWGRQTESALTRAAYLWDALEKPTRKKKTTRLCRMLCRVGRNAVG